jgi:hypothetical protein
MAARIVRSLHAKARRRLLVPEPLRGVDRDQREDLTFAVVAMSVFWAALLMGFAFPGTAETAAEHPEVVPTIGPLRLNEVFIAVTSETATLIAFFFERRRR